VVEAKVMGDDIRHWKGKIFGPVSKHTTSYFFIYKSYQGKRCGSSFNLFKENAGDI